MPIRIPVWEITEELSAEQAAAFARHFRDLFQAYFLREESGLYTVIRLPAAGENIPLSHFRMVVDRSFILSQPF